MCMGEICQVRELGESGLALVHSRAGDQVARLLTLSDAGETPVATGDWLVVHSGFALRRLTEAQARDALAIREVDPTAELSELGIEEAS